MRGTVVLGLEALHRVGVSAENIAEPGSLTALWAGAKFRPPTVKIVVCAKQVVDPETPRSAFRIDPDLKRAIPAPGVPPVVNGFDENATEAALRISDDTGADVTVLSVGDSFARDVIKKPVSMGASELVLVEDPGLADLDSRATARVLACAIGAMDARLIICGRQASDWDNAQVPMLLAEMLGYACLTLCQDVGLRGEVVTARRVIEQGYEDIEADLPAVVVVGSEVGPPRYPTLRGIMAASRAEPTMLDLASLGLNPHQLRPAAQLREVFVPERTRRCEMIGGESDAESGRLLALRLREEGLL